MIKYITINLYKFISNNMYIFSVRQLQEVTSWFKAKKTVLQNSRSTSVASASERSELPFYNTRTSEASERVSEANLQMPIKHTNERSE